MARNPASQATTESTTGAQQAGTATGADTTAAAPTAPAAATTGTAAAAPATAAAGGNSARVFVNDPDSTPPYSGKIARADLIRKRWASGMSRGDITRLLNDVNVNPPGPDGQQKKVAYQIVNGAVKGLPGGPPKATTAPATIAASPPAAGTQVGGEGSATPTT
jgi:hypothetical protein